MELYDGIGLVYDGKWHELDLKKAREFISRIPLRVNLNRSDPRPNQTPLKAYHYPTDGRAFNQVTLITPLDRFIVFMGIEQLPPEKYTVRMFSESGSLRIHERESGLSLLIKPEKKE